MRYSEDLFLSTLGWSELEWMFRHLLELANEELELTVDEADKAVDNLVAERALQPYASMSKASAYFFFSWLCKRGNVVPFDTIGLSPRLRYKLVLPEGLAEKLKQI